MRYILPLLTLLCLTLAAPSAHAADPEPRTITTHAEATLYVIPDQAIVTLSIDASDPEAEKAVATCNESAAKLTAALKALGLEPAQIQSDALQVDTDTDNGNGPRRADPAGFTAHRGYAVKLQDPKLAEKVILTAIKEGSAQVQRVVYHSSLLRAKQDEARTQALLTARDKARAMAKALSANLGKPVTITEGPSAYHYVSLTPPNPGVPPADTPIDASGPQLGEQSPDPAPLGQIAVQATVSVTFALTD